MARNQEKSQSMLNRYLALKTADKQPTIVEKRPYMVSLENSLPKAEKWRRQIVGEISRKVAEIQNESLPEPRIRELNDEINRLFREKGHWERRIMELGGPNYAAQAVRIAKDEGEEVEEVKGYRYFGAARKLKGVAELLKPSKQEEEESQKGKTRGDLSKMVDIDYWGFRDEDDGVLLKLEAKAQKRLRAAAGLKEVESEMAPMTSQKRGRTGSETSDSTNIPSSKDMQQALLEKKKEEILKKYVSPSILSSVLKGKDQQSKGDGTE